MGTVVESMATELGWHLSEYHRQGESRMNKISSLLCKCIVISAFVMVLGCNYHGSEADNEAKKGASDWLALLDKGRLKESWKEASGYFQVLITQDRWNEALLGFRTPLGEVVSRSLGGTRHEKELPGAPNGKYIIVRYTTHFKHKANGNEIVVMMEEKGGSWRVAGYYIK